MGTSSEFPSPLPPQPLRVSSSETETAPKVPGHSRRDVLAAAGAGVAAAVAAVARPAAAAPSAAAGKPGFPRDFWWGAATAAYQIEGAAAVDGRGPSVWDTFCRKPGAVFEGHHGDVACDHYHRYKEDVALMRQLGVRSYRFSISWSRVLPEGRGAVNEKGLDFYKRLLDELLAARLVPMCTLFHWDFPQALFERGGWQNRDSADWFGDYAALIADRLSDRIEFFATQNEPQVYCGKGHLDGEHAPGLRLPFRDYLTVAHNSMRAHGRAVQALRASARRPLKIGYVPAIQGTQPAQETAQDIEAARHGFLRVADRNSWNNSWWLDPVILGRYPEDGLAAYAADLPRFPPRDLDDMKQPIDFLGLNIYWAAQWRAGASGPEQVHYIPGYPRSAVNWQPLTPAVMYWAPRFSWERWQLPMYITENGLATRDQIFLDGKVHDPQRIDVLHRYLSQLARATGEGIPVRGYYHWSLLDNFEWAEGYVQRFGIVYVDYGTQRRIPKDSYHWYRKVVASNGRTLSGRTAVPPLRMTDGG